MGTARELLQSTAATIKIGPFLDVTDPSTVLDSLTIAQADVRLSKEGGDYAQKNESSSCTHDEDGEYDCDLDATDTNTLGELMVRVSDSSAFPWKETYEVITQHEWDIRRGNDEPYGDSIWLDTNNGNSANSGTHRKPMDTIANAITKLTATGLKRLSIVNGSYVELGATMSYIDFRGNGSISRINLMSQETNNCSFRDLQVFGTSTTSSVGPVFNFCLLGTGSFPTFRADNCRIYGTITLTDTARLANCVETHTYSSIPAFDFNAPGSSLELINSNYRGRLEVQGMNANAKMLLSGSGQLTINADCTAGSITLMGLWDVVDNASGAVTVTTLTDETLGAITNFGTGPYTVTLTFNDSDTGDPIEGVSVRMRASAAEDLRGTTNASGQITFYPKSLTYTITATLSNYTLDSSPITLAVSGDATPTAYTMTANAITPSAGSYTTAFTKTYAPDGSVEGNVEVTCIPLLPPSGSVGIVFDATPLVATSAAGTGIVQFPNRVKGARYRFYRGENDLGIEWTIPTTADTTYELPSFTGKP